MFTSEIIAARTLREHIAGENAFCDADHVTNKFMAVFDELEFGMKLGHKHGERILAWRHTFKLFMQGHDLEALTEAEKLAAA